MSRIEHPFYPIIYIRGYAMTQEAIETAVASPYMGFNDGSTKLRQRWNQAVVKHIFESPLLRLIKDYGYTDSFRDGRYIDGPLPPKSVIIYRYYDEASTEFGGVRTPSVEEAAAGLSELILQLKDQVCGLDPGARETFKVYLVAHSMGGLIARAFIQNEAIGDPRAKECVAKIFTYGTPHNGIEVGGFNLPAWLGIWDIHNFSPERMARYLDLDLQNANLNSLNGKFDPACFFCLIGTNHEDYNLARFAVGPMSDGLVKIKNAYVEKAPRALVYRSHSGEYGLVNSEEGYQNLVRFLFGDVFVEATLIPEQLPLPPQVAAAKNQGKRIRASYHFESTVTPRGFFDVHLYNRNIEDSSAIFRSYDEMMLPEKVGLAEARYPILFSVFLDTAKIKIGSTLVFSIRLSVRSTEYEILETGERFAPETVYLETITIRATVHEKGWRLRYVLSDQWSEYRGRDIPLGENPAGKQYATLNLENKKGFKAVLKLDFGRWNSSPGIAMPNLL